MVQTEELARRIEEELNGNLNSVALGIKFKIHATEGLYKKTQLKANGTKQAFINGILRASGGDYTPISEINNLQTTMMLEFAIPKDQAHDFELITTSWAEDVLGEVYTIGSWTYLITPTPATPGQLDDRTPLGEVLPYSMVLSIQIIKNGMISNAVTWKIGNDQINVINAVFDTQRSPDTKPYANTGVCITENQYESSSIILTFPYSFTNAVRSIVNDILSENWENTYIISRDDTYANSFARECVMTTGRITEESGKIVAITCTFARHKATDETQE